MFITVFYYLLMSATLKGVELLNDSVLIVMSMELVPRMTAGMTGASVVLHARECHQCAQDWTDDWLVARSAHSPMHVL